MSWMQPVSHIEPDRRPSVGGVLSWEIEKEVLYSRDYFGVGRDVPINSRWYLRATVTEDLFDQLVVALRKVGVSPPMAKVSSNAPAFFRSISRRRSLDEPPFVAFELEALDLRLLERQSAEKGIEQGYFMEGGK